MNISCYFPGQPNSITKKLTDHEYSRREIALTCLAAGILSATIGYTQKNAFLATGTGVLVANQILYIDTQDEVKMPMRILSFVSFCSFVGLSLKQSWVKPSNIAPSSWTRSLIKTTLSLLALSTLNTVVNEGEESFARYTVKTLDEKSSTRLLIIGALTASATSTFLIPRLGYFTFFAYLSSYSILLSAMQTKESLGESLDLAKKSVKYPLLLLLGSSLGLFSRSLLGPKNYTPSLPLLAKVPLYSMTAILPLLIPSLFTNMEALSEEPIEFMTTDFSPFTEKNLKEDFLKRVQSANHRLFSSCEQLDDHISQDFPGLFNFLLNKVFIFFILGRHTRERSIQVVLSELKKELDKIP